MQQLLTRQFFDTLIVVVIVIGLALAVVRLYTDLSRKLPPEPPRSDRQPNGPRGDDQP
jgi:hypothetical protein